MENKNSGIILGMVSLISAFCSVFTMFYIFVTVSVITALAGLKKENSRLMAITSLVIVAIVVVLKVISKVEGILPSWLLEGLF